MTTSDLCTLCGEDFPLGSNKILAGDEGLFHDTCFNCAHCEKSLAGLTDGYIPKDGKLYCVEDYHVLFGERCAHCEEILFGPIITALGNKYHPDHFVCYHCAKPFDDENQFFKHEGEDGVVHPYCKADYFMLFPTICARCDENIEGNLLEALGKKWHEECFRCYGCDKGFDSLDDDTDTESTKFYAKDGNPFCVTCFESKILLKCAACETGIKSSYIKALGRNFHKDCFCCQNCSKSLVGASFMALNDAPICQDCHNDHHEIKEETDIVGLPLSAPETPNLSLSATEVDFLDPCEACGCDENTTESRFCGDCGLALEIQSPVEIVADNDKYYDKIEEIVEALDKKEELNTEAIHPRETKPVISTNISGPMSSEQTYTTTTTTTNVNNNNNSSVPEVPTTSHLMNDAVDTMLFLPPCEECGFQKNLVEAKFCGNCRVKVSGADTYTKLQYDGFLTPSYPHENLRLKPYPPNIHVDHRELHLFPNVFESKFHMKLPEFLSLPKWRQKAMKKNLGLF